MPRIRALEIIDARLMDLAEAADRNAAMIDERLASRIQLMSKSLARTAAEANSSWEARGGELAASIGFQVDQLHRLIDGKGAELTTALGERGGEFAASIGSQIDQLHRLIDGRGTELTAALGERGEQLSASISSR